MVNLRIPCPECGRILRVPPGHVEHQVRCKFCFHVFLVPKYLDLACPTCQRRGRVRTVHVGRQIKCKHCGGSLHAVGTSSGEVDTAPARVLGISKAASGHALSMSSSDSVEVAPSQAVERLRGELASRMAESVSAFQELGEALEQIRGLQSRVQELEARLGEAVEAPTREQRLRQELEDARTELRGLRIKLAVVDRAPRQRDLIEAEQHGYGSEGSDLWARLESTGHEIEADHTERDQLEEDLRATAAEAVRLRLKLEEAERELAMLRAEHDRSMAERHSDANEKGEPRPRLHTAVAAQLEGAWLEHDRLQKALESSAAELTAVGARLEEQGGDLEAARAERDRLADELDAAANAAGELRVLVSQIDLKGQATAEVDDSAQAHVEAHAESAKEHALRARLEETEARLREEHERAVAERQLLNEQLDALNRRFDQGCQALQEEIQRLCDENQRLRKNHERAQQEAEARAALAARSATEQEAAATNLQEAVAQHQSSVAEAALALDQARRRQAEAEQRLQELRVVLAQSVAEQERQRQHHEGQLKQYEHGLIALREELQTARSEWAVQRAGLAETADQARAELADELEDARNRLEEATTRAVQLEAELQRANDQTDALCRDAGLVRGDGTAPATANGETPDATSTKRRIEELTMQLHQARRETTHLRSILDYLGIEDHAQRP